jgi:hypothetical protein
MGYADEFAVDESYRSKKSGSHIEILIVDANDPANAVIGAAAGINWSDDFEQIAVEEAGNDGVDEIVTGRMAGSGSINAFWTPQWNDRLPSRQDFINKEFIIYEQIGTRRPFEGTVVNAFVGAKISQVGSSHAARGAKMTSLSFLYETRYRGADFASISGL